MTALDYEPHAPTSKRVIRNKYISNRRGSLAADLGDDDDMREEIDRLNHAQLDLQRELMDCMKAVEIMQHVEQDDEEEEAVLGGLATKLGRPLSQEPSSHESTTSSLEASETSLMVEEEQPAPTPQSFSKGFFKLIKPKESLEAQRQRQLEIVKENLKDIDPELEESVDYRREMQQTIVLKKKQLGEMKSRNEKKLQDLLQQKTNSLEEEKLRQMEILKINLQLVEPGLEDVMEAQRETQAYMVEKKKEEVEDAKKVVEEKLQELCVDKNQTEQRRGFWSLRRRSDAHR